MIFKKNIRPVIPQYMQDFRGILFNESVLSLANPGAHKYSICGQHLNKVFGVRHKIQVKRLQTWSVIPESRFRFLFGVLVFIGVVTYNRLASCTQSPGKLVILPKTDCQTFSKRVGPYYFSSYGAVRYRCKFSSKSRMYRQRIFGRRIYEFKRHVCGMSFQIVSDGLFYYFCAIFNLGLQSEQYIFLLFGEHFCISIKLHFILYKQDRDCDEHGTNGPYGLNYRWPISFRNTLPVNRHHQAAKCKKSQCNCNKYKPAPHTISSCYQHEHNTCNVGGGK